jgi:hypothetical protein
MSARNIPLGSVFGRVWCAAELVPSTVGRTAGGLARGHRSRCTTLDGDHYDVRAKSPVAFADRRHRPWLLLPTVPAVVGGWRIV